MAIPAFHRTDTSVMASHGETPLPRSGFVAAGKRKPAETRVTLPATNHRRLLSLAWTWLLIFPMVSHAANNEERAKLYFSHIAAYCNNKEYEACRHDLRDQLSRFKTDCSEIDKECKPGSAILQELFGSAYRSTLPDYVVYFDQSRGDGQFDKHPPILMWQGKNTPHLYGAHNIYAIVLTEYRVCLQATITTDYRNEPNPFSALFNAIGTSTESAQPKASESKGAEFTWYPLSGDANNTPMWFAFTRLGIDVNTSNRITVRYIEPADFPQGDEKNPPSRECRTPSSKESDKEGASSWDASKAATRYNGNFLAANGFFSNSPGNRATMSLALGMTTNTRETSVASGGSDKSFNGYALAKIYLVRPQLLAGPDHSGMRPSWAFVFGTNLTNRPFDEIVVGFSWGHLIGNAGVVLGVNSLAGRKDTTEGRQSRGFIGIDYSL